MGHLISKIRSYQQPAADLPDHLLMDILSRLPVKDLLRLKSASKTWSALIAEPYFINLHRSRASCTIIGTASYRNRCFTPPNIFPMTRKINILSSTNGLLCVETSNRRYGICNPATNKWLKLPTSMHEQFYRLKLYTVPSTGVLKVLGTIEGGGGADILTVEGGSTSTWRPMQVTPLEHDQVPWCSYLFDDGAHWLRCILDDSPHRQSLSKEVWSLDIETEQVVTCKIPSFLGGSIKFVIPWDGRLSICFFSGQKMRAWILEDYRINRWRKEEVVLPSMFKDRNRSQGKPWFVRSIHEGKMWCENGANKFFLVDLKSKRVNTFNFAVRKIKHIVPYVPTLETLEGSQ